MPSGTYLTRRVLPYLLLMLPVLFYLAITLFWQSEGMYGLTGDEPHYLLVTDSLYRDHDLRVENNYLSETPVSRACRVSLYDPVDMQRHVRNGYSMHYAGLPLILIIPYGLAGVSGAKIFMALIAGFWPFILYKAAFQIIRSKPWSILIALTLALGLPYLPVSNQHYIDLLGGMIILYLAQRVIGILRGYYTEFNSPASNLWFGLLVGFLPWLHVRLSAPAILLLLGYVYATFIKPRQPQVAARGRWLLMPVAIVACSGILLAAYNQIAFGNALFGPYYGVLSYDIRKIALTFAGLHWDMSHGLFMQQPLLILGLVGILPLVKDNRESALLLALVSLSVLLPNSMLSNWYGASSFVGRYNWAIVSLWVFPLAYTVKLLSKYRKFFLLPLCLCCLALQAWMAGSWLYVDGLLMNTGFPVWATRSFYSENPWLLLRLPFFRNVYDYENLYYCLTHPANYICIALSAVLIISGWLVMRGSMRSLAAMWSLFLIAGGCAFALTTPAAPPWYIKAELLPSEVGTKVYESKIAREGESGAGYLTFGPYIVLLEGQYEVTVEYESGTTSTTQAPQFDIVYDILSIVAPKTSLPPSETNGGKFKYRFRVDKEISMKKRLEFRVWYTGSGTLLMKRLTLAYLRP